MTIRTRSRPGTTPQTVGPDLSLPPVLIVSDDESTTVAISNYLRQHGYRVSAVANNLAVMRVRDNPHVGLVLLDALLPTADPATDALVLCRRIRGRSVVPIIIASATNNSEERVLGFEAGADDYIVKPFNLRELLGRIRAVHRRALRASGNIDTPSPNGYRFADWRLDVRSHTLQHADGSAQTLTASDFLVMELLVTHPLQIVSRSNLVQLIYGRDWDPLGRNIDSRISRIRRLLRENHGFDSHRLIKSVYGKGYILACPVDAD
ncbi:MAG: response regulator transcription factor [Gammaproteobacteria bacterium]